MSYLSTGLGTKLLTIPTLSSESSSWMSALRWNISDILVHYLPRSSLLYTDPFDVSAKTVSLHQWMFINEASIYEIYTSIFDANMCMIIKSIINIINTFYYFN